MPKAFVNGINIHYQRAGQGQYVVMIHGIASNLAIWLNIQRIMAEPTLNPSQEGREPKGEAVGERSEQFQVITYDLRGHGYSDMPQKAQ